MHKARFALCLSLIVCGIPMMLGCPRQQAVIAVSLTPEAAYVTVGQTQAFQVMAFDAGGSSQDITARATFTLAPASLGTVSAAGLFTAGTTAGTGILTAAYQGFQAMSAITVAPEAPVLTVESLSLIPASVTLRAFESRQMTVAAAMSDGSVVTVTQGSVFSLAPADLGSITDEGLLLATRANVTGTLTAMYEGHTATAAITVQQDVLDITALRALPAEADVVTGGRVNFRLVFTLSDGSVHTVAPTQTAVEPPDLGIMVGDQFTASVTPGTGLVRLSLNTYSTSAVIRVIGASGQTQGLILDIPGASGVYADNYLEFSLGASLASGQTVDVTQQGTYLVTPDTLGSVDYPGIFTAGSSAGTGFLTAVYSGRTASVALMVLETPIAFSLASESGATAFAAGTPFTLHISLANSGAQTVWISRATCAFLASTAAVSVAIDNSFVPPGSAHFIWTGQTGVMGDLVQMDGASDDDGDFLGLAPGASVRFARLILRLRTSASLELLSDYLSVWDSQERYLLNSARTPAWVHFAVTP